MNSSVWTENHLELRRFVKGRIKERAVAEDIAHDVLLKAHAKLGQLKDAEKIKSWIYQIARNTIADYYRNKT